MPESPWPSNPSTLTFKVTHHQDQTPAVFFLNIFSQIIVIGVESERCASFSSALKVGQPIYTKADSTLADGLAVPKVGINSLATAAPLVDKCVVVKEEYIAMAILRFLRNNEQFESIVKMM